MTYATETTVPVERSRAEIERMVLRAGAKEFASAFREDAAVVLFTLKGRLVRFNLPLPKLTDPGIAFKVDRWGHKKSRGPEGTRKAWDQECRRRWRALALVVKAKLEAVETGITTFEQEFLAYLVGADNMTVGERVIPNLDVLPQGNAIRALLGSGQGAPLA